MGLDKDAALEKTAKWTRISKPAIFSFLKEKLRAGGVTDNKNKHKNRQTMYEKLSLEEIDIIRHLVHDIFATFRKTKGEPKDQKIEAEFPTYGNTSLHSLWAF